MKGVSYDGRDAGNARSRRCDETPRMDDTNVMRSAPAAPRRLTSGWHLLSNHALVLLAVARHPSARIRDVADAVGLTDRACQRILNDLTDAGYVGRRRVGRRNEYAIDSSMPMPHPMVQVHQVAELISTFAPGREQR